MNVYHLFNHIFVLHDVYFIELTKILLLHLQVTRRVSTNFPRGDFFSPESTKSEEIVTATRKSEREEKQEKRGRCRRKSV